MKGGELYGNKIMEIMPQKGVIITCDEFLRFNRLEKKG